VVLGYSMLAGGHGRGAGSRLSQQGTINVWGCLQSHARSAGKTSKGSKLAVFLQRAGDGEKLGRAKQTSS
jgi:hypothetical protein